MDKMTMDADEALKLVGLAINQGNDTLTFNIVSDIVKSANDIYQKQKGQLTTQSVLLADCLEVVRDSIPYLEFLNVKEILKLTEQRVELMFLLTTISVLLPKLEAATEGKDE